MAKIEIIYQARIDYEVTTYDQHDGTEKVEARAFQVTSKLKVECQSFLGNSACSPYILLTSYDYNKVELAAERIETYIRRFKDHKFIA